MSRRVAFRLVVALVMGLLIACASSHATEGASCLQSIDPSIPKAEPGGAIIAPRVLQRMAPHATGDAVRRLPLTAAVEAVIEADGAVGQVCRVSGDPEWAKTLADAVRQWRFEPATLDGKPLAVRFTITSSIR